jgi:cell wall-associated NlpC family hydrolase
MRGAIIAGAVTAGTVALPAAPAMAATVSIPGFGDVTVPDAPALPPMPALPQISLPPIAPPPIAPPIAEAPKPPVQATVGERALEAARTKVGAMYSYGAAGPNAFDCSGLVQWAYKQAGVNIPRTSFQQAGVGAPVSVKDLRPGDIVITNGGGHAGVYAGDGQIVHASTSGQPVKYAPLNQFSVYTARRL